MKKRKRTVYPSDVSDDKRAIVAPCLTLCKGDSEQREIPLRAVFDSVAISSAIQFLCLKHCFLVIRKNRIYHDEVLGDVSGANGELSQIALLRGKAHRGRR